MLHIPKAQRSLCAQLRSGTLPLALETGRFNGTPEEQRLCLLCPLGEIENELHFMFHCPLYDLPRDVLFTKMQELDSDFFYMEDYAKLNLCFHAGAFHTAVYIDKAWELRRNALFTGL